MRLLFYYAFYLYGCDTLRFVHIEMEVDVYREIVWSDPWSKWCKSWSWFEEVMLVRWM